MSEIFSGINSIEFELDQPVYRDRYDRLFESCETAFIQQSSDWADVIAAVCPDRPIFLLCEQNGVDIAGLPLYLYHSPLGNILTSVPAPGPLGGIFTPETLSSSEKAQVYHCLLEHTLRIAKRYQCISLTIITNPLICDLSLYEQYLEPTYVFKNFTQYIPLTTPVKRSRKLRQNLNRAKEFGFQITVNGSRDELLEWHQIHQQRHQQLQVQPLELRLFERLMDVLIPKKKALFLLARHGDEIASGCFYIFHRRHLDVYLISMNDAFAEQDPNSVITDYSIALASEYDWQVYNWQSSPSRNSGVYEYKRRWGSIERPYYFVTKLLVEPQQLLEIDPVSLKIAYPGHYVIPFAAYAASPDQKYFEKS
jgi:Acetyltransferase (GNAT) domain